ncbi:MAG: PHP domain-containing protein, partial [Lapillicoccus sp.]
MPGLPDAFVHLHVASGYSMRYGASTPSTLVQRAVAWGQPALALTDRDGLYGAVRFVQACADSGIAPILGVDLAVRVPSPEGRRRAGGGGAGGRGTGGGAGGPGGMWDDLGRRSDQSDRAGGAFPPSAAPRSPTVRTPVRGGAIVDARLPRVTILARGRFLGLDPGAGWARLCQLVTRTHFSGERGDPVSTPELIAELARPPGHPSSGAGSTSGSTPGSMSRSEAGGCGPSPLVVLLGPDSDVGRAALARRRDLSTTALARWQTLLPRDALAIEVVCHGGPEGTPANLGHAARLYALARDHGIRVVLTAAVRHADPEEAATVDVLDAARRLVALDVRHL